MDSSDSEQAVSASAEPSISVGGFIKGNPPSENGSKSLADLMKDDLEELKSIQDVYIKVPGYKKTGLHVKYLLPTSGQDLSKVADEAAGDFKSTYNQNLYTAIDTMIELCDGLYANPSGDGETFIAVGEDGNPIKFDNRLAEIMGWKSDSARAAVRQLFKENEFAIMDHAARLNRWLADTSTDVTKAFWQGG